MAKSTGHTAAPPSAGASANPLKPVQPAQALATAVALAAVLAAFTFFQPVTSSVGLTRAFWMSALFLVGWGATLLVWAKRRGVDLTYEVVIRRHHWVQACAQATVYLYWGWHVRSVYAFAPLILGQVVFAYGVDALLSWSRRGKYTLGFGSLPIIGSINLFLWFKPEWFHWQFALIVVGYFAKELIRWQKDGRSAHIFNPSSFPLGVFSIALILTGTTDITLGLEIAQTQFIPPNMFLVIFLAALPGMLLFGVTTMTMSAVVTAYVFGLAYESVTGLYYFYDAYIPIAVFLGMHLLFTDPSTSPRSELGRVIFGVIYGFGTIGFVVVLNAIGAPTFYDKLLPVPIMNLMVRRIDLVAAGITARIQGPRTGDGRTRPNLAGRRYATVGLWVVTFAAIRAAGGVGDEHPGQYLPYWDQGCEAGYDRACDYLSVMQENYCERGSGWACNELAINLAEWGDNRRIATLAFQQACDQGFPLGCTNRSIAETGGSDWRTAPPPVEELPIVLRGSKGPVLARTADSLYALGCERGWEDMCAGAPGSS